MEHSSMRNFTPPPPPRRPSAPPSPTGSRRPSAPPSPVHFAFSPEGSSMKMNEDPTWLHALQTKNSVAILKTMMNEISKVPYKVKKSAGASNDSEYLQKIIQEMADMLKHEFLHVDLVGSTNRDVNETNWSTLNACKRSDSGTVGIIFLQCTTPQKTNEILVSKAITIEDYEKTLFVNEIANKFFHIHCPKIRFIERIDEEFIELKYAVKDLFFPVNEELYYHGGHHSPKDLFSSQGIMLLEYVRGKPLCHRSQGQRVLQAADYHVLGKLFLLDLIIRNTDRLPCNKAMPRPGSKHIHDHGNAGNIMFGGTPGEVWSIDPEMQTKVEVSVENHYGEMLESVVFEIVNQEANESRYKSIELLFFTPFPGFVGILDYSLNDITPWDTQGSIEREAIGTILQMIRIRAYAEDGYIVKRAGGINPPGSNDEKEWKDWIRLAAPRAMIDIFHFLEVFTGYQTPSYAAHAFESGFFESIIAAQQFKAHMDQTGMNPNTEGGNNILAEAGSKSASIDISFILRMVERICKLCSDELIQKTILRHNSSSTSSKTVRRRSQRLSASMVDK